MSPNETTNSNSTSKSHISKLHAGEPLLKRYDDKEVHDLVCVGFGPASLAIAVALYDALEGKDLILKTHEPKVRFLERQPGFSWHAGMLLPGTRLQISFIKDLATLRNPRSKFTFLNYLHEKGRLVSFTNLGTFLPLRIEYEDYLRWCAEYFADIVDYGQTVEIIQPGLTDPGKEPIEDFVVRSQDRFGASSTIRTRNVVIAVGGRPNLPTPFDIRHPRIIHSSEYATSIARLFSEGDSPNSIAVVGAGQSAAEVFHDIGTRFPTAKSFLLIRDSALRPSDDSPFVNEIFDPERVTEFYSKDEKARFSDIDANKATNYGVVRIELLEAIYSKLYSNRIQYRNEDDWPQRILARCTVKRIEILPPGSKSALQLYVCNEAASDLADGDSKREHLNVDLLVVASGYRRDVHLDMLKDIRCLMNPNDPGDCNSFEVGRDYRIRLNKNAVREDAGIWLQGCSESTHGLSDTLLSILATRGGELVNSIFGASSMSSGES